MGMVTTLSLIRAKVRFVYLPHWPACLASQQSEMRGPNRSGKPIATGSNPSTDSGHRRFESRAPESDMRRVGRLIVPFYSPPGSCMNLARLYYGSASHSVLAKRARARKSDLD
ncbi:hypothetical protein LZ554_009163 [Drepanopeziza brunnea f. sp. 'monogermtubi']|nr:hypothetical protein LZ554_009163 [Drepanopeziza brunnea f. sp. 'monogermtubi']